MRGIVGPTNRPHKAATKHDCDMISVFAGVRWAVGAAVRADWAIHEGDVLAVLASMPDASVHCCVTSPPYWGLRDYGVEGAYGLEPTLDEYLDRMVDVFREVRRVLRDDGTLWLNCGDAYAR